MSDVLFLPNHVIEAIRNQCEISRGEKDTKSVLIDLEGFIDTKLKYLEYTLYKYFKEKKLDKKLDDKLRRALYEKETYGISIKETDSFYRLLCCYACNKKFEEAIKELELDEKNLNRPPIDILLKKKQAGITALGVMYWKTTKLANKNYLLKSLSRYYTHLDSLYTATAVAQDSAIVEPLESYETIDSDNIPYIKTLAQIINTAMAERFSLIKLFAEGGVGKTTYLFWIAKQYCEKFDVLSVEKLDHLTSQHLADLLDEYPKKELKPILLLIDDIASINKPRIVSDFFEGLRKSCTHYTTITVIVAERANRITDDFNMLLNYSFGGNVQTIKFQPTNKEELFEKFYSELLIENPSIENPETRERAKAIYMTSSISSPAEAAFYVLLDLKLNDGIDYDFDWDDWDEFIGNNYSRFGHLRNLFTIVACFYQFGIKLPISFQSAHLPNAGLLDIQNALTEFTSEKKSICQEDNEFLKLKHEYVAVWYSKTPKGEALIKSFFESFLKSISDINSARLFRKMRKLITRPELKQSCLKDILTPEKALASINAYLEIESISDLEWQKMMNERGILLLTIPEEQQAIETFIEVADKFPDNNYCRDQLAKIYQKKKDTYHLALKRYEEIESNGATYATSQIVRLKRKAMSEGIKLHDFAERSASPTLQHIMINHFIAEKNFDLAIEVLERISEPTVDTAEHCRQIAHQLSFTRQNISIKQSLYLKSISIYKLVCGSENVNYSVEYATVLFKLNKFTPSTREIARLKKNTTPMIHRMIDEVYRVKISSIDSLFLIKLPAQDERERLEEFLLSQCQRANAILNQPNALYSTLQASLILSTVRNISRSFPHIYQQASEQLAYIYYEYAEKKWNEFTPYENRGIAEMIFDDLWKKDCPMEINVLRRMISNLIKINTDRSYRKVIKLVNRIVLNERVNKYPGFNRFRGYAKQRFSDFKGALSDYIIALRLCSEYKSSYSNIEECNTLNNLSNMICELVERNINLNGLTIKNARICAERIRDINKDFFFLGTLMDRINRLDNRN